MIPQELRELKTGARELRKFGLTVGGVLAALGLVMLARGKAHFPWFLAPGMALLALGAALPKALKHVYIAWMGLALALGFVVSHVILTVFFFLVITPVGLAAWLLGKDFLRRRLDRQAPTYWLQRERPKTKAPSDYERQY
jgi:Ca2+/Na+ antiporter